MKKVLLLCLLICNIDYLNCSIRWGKKDKEDLLNIVAEPMRKIEQKIDSINQAANQIQNFIVDNYNQPVDQELKEQYHQILNKLAHLGLLLEALAYVIQAQTQYIQELGNHVGDLEYTVSNLEQQLANVQAAIGSLSDLSVGQEIFDSVDDIDESQRSLVSWAKTTYRQQLHDKFIS